MADPNRTLLELFQLADGLLLPDEAVLEAISKKQRSLTHWNEDIVLQGLTTMKQFLQSLAGHNHADLANSMDEMAWVFRDGHQNHLPKSNPNFPSVWELTRHLSNWTMVFIPPVRALDLRGDMELISCLESRDRSISALAAIMLGFEEFNHIGSIEKFNEILNNRNQTILRLEICRLIYTRYHDPEVLRVEIVPNLITSNDQYDIIFESDVQRKRLLSYIRDLVVWDIVTKSEGPRRKWASWWV
jgi:hypothetical protein